MATMYHTTESDAVAQILRDGLEARQSLATTAGRSRLGAVVSLFADAAEADLFGIDNFAAEGYTVLAVDVDGLELSADPEYDAGVAWGCGEDVEPDRLTVWAVGGE